LGLVQPAFEKTKFSQPSPTPMYGESDWLTGWNPFWHL